MKAVIAAVVLALATLCSPAAKAWNCPSGQIRQQAPAGTPTNTPNYDVVEGIAFICVPATTPAPSSNSANSSSNSTSNSTSASNANSNSNSNSSATGGNATATGGNQSQKQNQNQSQTATGGSATGGTSNASATNNSNGNNSNNTTVNTPRQVATAYAPPSFNTANCLAGISAGAQTGVFGASFGASKVDKGCEARATAASFAEIGNRLAAARILCNQRPSKEANLSIEDCLQFEAVAQAGPSSELLPAPVPVVINVAPSPAVVVPAPVVNVIGPAPAPSVVVTAPAVKHKPAVKHPCPVVPPACPALPPNSAKVYSNDDLENLRPENR